MRTMAMSGPAAPLRAARAAVAAVAALVACAALLAVAAPSARAGRWVQVSCVNPNGSAAPNEGWSGATLANAAGQTPGDGSWVYPRCGPGVSMSAGLSTLTPDPPGVAERLEYQPPAGSTIVGGTLNVAAEAVGGAVNASANVYMYEPAYVYPADVIYQCTYSLNNCGANPHRYTGPVTLPSDAGGDLFVAADCTGAAGAQCNSGGADHVWSSVAISSAHIDLSNNSVPTGVNFTGTVLDPTTHGTPHLLFTASDPGGPGVYAVTVSIDGVPVWSGTPDTNDGACVPVGTEAGTGALMFDHQQPCPAAEQVALGVPTTSLADGDHELSVTIVDAAGNTATVFDHTIKTSNPQLTPKPRRGVKAQFQLSWRWKKARTTLRWIKVRKLPRVARVHARCTGRHCPKLKVKSVRAKHVRTLLRELHGRTFRAGDRLLITVTAPHRRAERVQLKMRSGHQPTARLLKR